jgi:transcriptional regulator with XRE-family HTH domain
METKNYLSDFGRRLENFVYKRKNLNGKEVSARANIDKSTMSNIINAKHKTTNELMYKLWKAFPDLNIHYLVTGTGPETAPKDESIVEDRQVSYTSPYAADQVDYLKQELLRVNNMLVDCKERAKQLEVDKNDLRDSRDFHKKMASYPHSACIVK